MTIRVFNADDHPILRKGIIDLLVETEGIEWVGSAADGQEAWDKINMLQPDIAVLDIEMPHMTGIELAKKIIDSGLNTRVILLTLFKDSSFVKKAIEIGVNGYLLKESSEKEIVDCIKSVSEGSKYISPALTQVLLEFNKEEDELSMLTDHEKNIIKLISRNKTSKEIADMLFLSPKTISNHRANICKKLDLDGQQNALLKWVLERKELFS